MKSTKAQFELFKKECLKWIDIFGMKGYRFYFRHQDFGEAAAYCEYPTEIQHRFFILGLSVNFSDDYADIDLSPEAIKRNAFHEVAEAFMCRMSVLANSRCVREDEIKEERHNIIHVLERLIFDKYD